MKKVVEDGRNKEQTSYKKAKRGAKSAALGMRRGRRNMFGGTSTTTGSSQRDDGWNYVAGSTQEEVEEYEIRKTGSKTCGGGGWPETAASQP
ncbi:hypothetical protein ACFX13_022731 [Malus domestica]